MYLSFYGLTEKPFSQTPDPKFLYWNDAYRETIASLRYGIQERKGFVTMIGEAGTGKTTLLRKLLDDLGPDVVSVFLFNPNASFEEILEYTLSELGIPAASGRKLAMMQRLNDFLLAAFQEGKNTILLIDEAQDLETEVLESLRLLSNLETAKDKILQIVLSGQPELAQRLAQPNLRQLKQRIAVRCRIEPLGRHELADYIAARLSVAGGRPDLFAAATLDPIWEFARGIPRLINTVCDNALLVGYALGRQTIDAQVVAEVVSDLGKIDVPLGLAPLPVQESPVPPLPVAPASATPLALAPELPAIAPPAATAVAQPSEASTPRTAPPAPAPARLPRASLAGHDVAPGQQRRSAGFAIALIALLSVLAAGAWAALRWQDLRPRLQALLAEPRLAATDDSARSYPPRAEPIEVDRRVSLADTPAVPAAAKDAVDPVPTAQIQPPHAVEEAVALQEPGAAAEGDIVQPGAPRGALEPVPPAEQAELLLAQPTAAETVESAPPAAVMPISNRQDLQAAGRPGRASKRILVQRGDTLMNLAARQYGYSTYTVLDVVRAANPGIQDVNRIIAGSQIVFPDPGPSARVVSNDDGVSVLVATTPALYQAQEIQRLVGSRYRLPADLEPVALGDGRSLYRVSLRQVPDETQALKIAESLGSILRDPS